MKKKNIVRISIISLVVLIIILVVAKKFGWIGEGDAVKVATEIVKKRDITEVVSASGKVQPEIEVKISPDVSGEIVELYIKEGNQVKKGDLLAKINPDIYISMLARMEAALNSQKANLLNSKARLTQVKAQFVNAKSIYDRNVKLWNQKTISEAEFDNAKAQFEVAKSEVDATSQSVEAAEYAVKSSEASVKESKDNLIKTSIFAPMDGTVSKLNIEKGERVVGTSQFAGTEIMRIANLSVMEVNINVNENDIIRVKVGDTALVEVDAYLKRKFKGIVTEIANTANVTGLTADQVTNFEVKIRILEDSYKDLTQDKPVNFSPFRPGMSATVDIQTKTVRNVISVPIQAVTARDDTTRNDKLKDKKDKNKEESEAQEEVTDNNAKLKSNNEYVFVLKDSKAVMQKVKTGIQDNNYIEILEGVSEGIEVITAPYKAISKTLLNRDAVKKVDKKELFDIPKK